MQVKHKWKYSCLNLRITFCHQSLILVVNLMTIFSFTFSCAKLKFSQMKTAKTLKISFILLLQSRKGMTYFQSF